LYLLLSDDNSAWKIRYADYAELADFIEYSLENIFLPFPFIRVIRFICEIRVRFSSQENQPEQIRCLFIKCIGLFKLRTMARSPDPPGLGNIFTFDDNAFGSQS
jgi:hypothetical protein